MELTKRNNLSFIFIIVFIMTGIIASFLLFESNMNEWVQSSSDSLKSPDLSSKLLGSVFVIALLTFDVLLPIPSSIVSAFSASALGLNLGVFSIWSGLTLGSCFGYWVGRYSDKMLLSRWLKEDDHGKAKQLSSKLGLGALITMRGVPVLAETSVIAAGIVRYPWIPFFTATTLANFGLALAYGLVGAQTGIETPFLAVFAGSITVPLLAWGLQAAWVFVKKQSAAEASGTAQVQQTAAQQSQIKSGDINAEFTLAYRYPVQFTEHAFSKNNDALIALLSSLSLSKHKAKVLVVMDSGLANSQPDLKTQIENYFAWFNDSAELATTPMVFTGGEQGKQASEIEILYQIMWQLGIDRHAFVLAIGGGAMLDAVGYCCATFHRGIKLIRMPSTTLAQNDAGVGVKNGYNLLNAKNLIGTFCPPNAVLNDFALLQSLTPRDKRAGLAEAVKVAAIRSSDFFLWLEQQAEQLAVFAPEASQYAIKECARLHIAQITNAGDPFESGSARPLDYGHWSAHKLESLSEYQLRHGEAVAIGMALDAIYAADSGMLSQQHCDRLIALLHKLGFALWHSALDILDEYGQPQVLQGIEEFRQHLGGHLCITLLRDLGIGIEVNELNLVAMNKALQTLKNTPVNLSEEKPK